MTNKTRRQVLSALTAAALLGAAAPAYALDTDHILVSGKDMDADLVDPGKGGYIYGILGGNAYMDSQTVNEEGDTVDGGIKGTVGSLSSVVNLIKNKFPSIADAFESVKDVTGKTQSAEVQTAINGNTGLTLENYGHDWIRYYGAIGGDLSVNTGLDGSINFLIYTGKEPIQKPTEVLKESQATTIVRQGDVNNVLESGSVIAGVGGSAAAAIGNVKAELDYTTEFNLFSTNMNLDLNVDAELHGKTHVTIDGSVTTAIQDNANAVGWMNGGLAAGVGGTATSTVTGNSVISIDGTNRADHVGSYEEPGKDAIPPVTTILNVMKGSKVNAIGVMGGGTAVTTLGGEATAAVDGSTSITANNATVIGLVGGGAAASVDITGVAEQIYKPNGQELQMGNDNGTMDVTGKQLQDIIGQSIPDDLTITITATDAIDGGTATATTGDTNIALTGKTTAVGVMGGGIAAASHTYTWKGDGTNSEESHNVNDAYGSAVATAETGRSTIVVNLEGDADIGAARDAIQNLYKGLTSDSTQATDLAGLKDQGMALGILGGGAAIAHGSASSTLTGDAGASATAATAGSDILLQRGYAAGVFGGGAAVSVNNARATAEMTDDVNITTASGMETVGLFGGGLALSIEGSTVGTSSVHGSMTDPAAVSTAQTVNIINNGDTDGIYGGGVAIGNSNRTGKVDAVASVETSRITVNGGTVSTMNAQVLMDALHNKNNDDNGGHKDDPWPQWSFAGLNASSWLADGKGLLDEGAIVAGGLAIGMTGSAAVETAEVTVNGGTVAGSILGGGIAIDNMNDGAGAHVGETTINLNGGAVEGSVYAGGAINKTTSQKVYDKYSKSHMGYGTGATSSTVDKATVVLNGATVDGEISGQGFELTTHYGKDGSLNPYDEGNDLTYEKEIYESVGDSALVITGTNTLTALGTEGSYTSTHKIHDFDTISVEAGSVTRLEGLEAGNKESALIDGGLVTVDETAALDVTGLAQSDTPYHVAINTEEGSTFWTNDSLRYDRTEGYATGDAGEAGDHYDLTWSALSEENAAAAASDMASAIDAGPLEGLIEDAMAKGWSADKGILPGGKDYFADWSSQAPAMNEAYGRGVLFGEDAAVTGNTMNIARVMADTVMERLSFTDDYIQDNGWVNQDGGIWAKYIHRRYETDSMGSSFGGLRSHTDYDGAIVGVDFKKSGKFQSGVAFHYGSGDGYGRMSHNDYDAWGFTLYGSIKDEEAHTNLMADIGYMTSDNDIDGTVGAHRLSADRDVDAWTIGIRGEKEFIAGHNQIVPYVGLRYMSLNPAAYSIYYDGQKAFNADADNQNLWMLPIGVTWRNETVTPNGWRVVPKVNLSYIWAFGDTDTDMTVDIGGAGSTLYYDVTDENSWLAALGLEATKDVWSFGLSYGYQKGSDSENRGWMVNLSYAF